MCSIAIDFEAVGLMQKLSLSILKIVLSVLFVKYCHLKPVYNILSNLVGDRELDSHRFLYLLRFKKIYMVAENGCVQRVLGPKW